MCWFVGKKSNPPPGGGGAVGERGVQWGDGGKGGGGCSVSSSLNTALVLPSTLASHTLGRIFNHKRKCIPHTGSSFPPGPLSRVTVMCPIAGSGYAGMWAGANWFASRQRVNFLMGLMQCQALNLRSEIPFITFSLLSLDSITDLRKF